MWGIYLNNKLFPICIVAIIELALSFLWKEVQVKRQHMKKSLHLISPFFITSLNFLEKYFWIPTKYLKSPCQYFTHGSTREQPILAFTSRVSDSSV